MWILTDWAYTRSSWPALTPIIALNSAVHVFMYGYYFLTSLYPLHDFTWKKRITQFQIVQFLIAISQAVYGYLYRDFCIYSIMYGAAMLGLFGNYYYYAFIKKPQKKGQWLRLKNNNLFIILARVLSANEMVVVNSYVHSALPLRGWPLWLHDLWVHTRTWLASPQWIVSPHQTDADHACSTVGSPVLSLQVVQRSFWALFSESRRTFRSAVMCWFIHAVNASPIDLCGLFISMQRSAGQINWPFKSQRMMLWSCELCIDNLKKAYGLKVYWHRAQSIKLRKVHLL